MANYSFYLQDYNNLMKRIYIISFFSILNLQFTYSLNAYKYSVDLTKVVDDKLEVSLIIDNITDKEATYRFPAIVPGTYAIYNFGRFISDFEAFDKNGKSIKFEKKDVNTFYFANANQLSKIKYIVEDSWDTDKKEDFVFEPAGTNIEDNKNFILNTFGFFGYFENYLKIPIELEVKKPKDFYPSTGLEDILLSKEKDMIKAGNYYEFTDSPIMYNIPDTTTLQVANTKVLVSVFSVQKKISAKFLASKIERILEGQKKYLGGTLPVNKYAFILYLTDKPTFSGASGALEHSYSSFYSLPEMDTARMAYTMADVASHEFFHIVTPLNIHSEEIGEFQFNNPKMSQHLWLYEGMTEYAAQHMQLKDGMVDLQQFIEKMRDKIYESKKSFNDTLPFTIMSVNCLDKYKKEYNNVYAKGAIIGLCLDIMLRDWSNGNYGTQNLMMDLAKKYGKNNSFKDEVLFDEITKLTFPEVRTFFKKYVEGNKVLPLKETMEKIGFYYFEKEEIDEISLGGFGFGFNPTTKNFTVADISEMNTMGKRMGYKMNDQLKEINNVPLTIQNAREVITGFSMNAKKGDKLKVTVLRKNWRGKEKLKTLKSKIVPVKITDEYIFRDNPNASTKQMAIRTAWMGI
jgi:predicted metalloprotease with PDZ domain